MTTKNNTKANRGRPRHHVTIPSKGKFTIKSIGVFNKNVARPVLSNRIKEYLKLGKIQVVGKIPRKNKGRRSYVFEVVSV